MSRYYCDQQLQVIQPDGSIIIKCLDQTSFLGFLIMIYFVIQLFSFFFGIAHYIELQDTKKPKLKHIILFPAFYLARQITKLIMK